jgi:uncharacterized cysteine cluster protein YcgN (CxxCxxCC family)
MSRRRSRSITARAARPGDRAAPATGVPPSASEGGKGGGSGQKARGVQQRARAPRERPPAPVLRPRFWETVPLAEMNGAEWEALCDGCGKCCLLKLEDADTGRVHYTDVTCRLFDCATRRCGQYALRRMFVPGCVVLTPENLAEAAGWMPGSCAYRRLHEGRGLPGWHPLVSGDPGSVARAGQALAIATTPEWEVDEADLEDHVLDDDLLTDEEAKDDEEEGGA